MRKRPGRSAASGCCPIGSGIGGRQQRLQEQEAGREAQEKALLNRFKVLSGELLEAGTDRLKKTNKAELDALLKPFAERLDSFENSSDAYGEERKQQGELSDGSSSSSTSIKRCPRRPQPDPA